MADAEAELGAAAPAEEALIEATSLASVDPECVEWIKGNVILPGGDKIEWQPEHEETLAEFIASTAHRRLLMWIDPTAGFSLSTSVPQTEDPVDIQYYLKPEVVLTADNVAKVVQFGTVEGAPVQSLLRLMTSVYVPRCVGDTSWPDTIKKEFTGQMHRFMASLTECAWDQRGTTTLYIPSEEGLDQVEVAAKQKDLVQRLESTLIHWTRQIKEVVNRQDDGEEEDSGPLAEVHFWDSRVRDLSGIYTQLELEGVKRIVAVLEQAKSSYLTPFEKLSKLILEGTTEAVDNLKFLENLTAPCEELAEATPEQIPAILPRILNVVRVIWRYSKFYNTPAQLAGLLRKVSNEIINRCRASISISEILDGDVQLSMTALSQSIAAVKSWFDLYDATDAAVKARGDRENTGRKWELDRSSIFAQIDAFVQRCRDLQEVCEGQTQFSRRGPGGETAELPTFGGAHGAEVTTQLLAIQASFERHIATLRGLDYDILDVKSTRWHDDYSAFKNSVKDLEVMFQNVVTTAFEGAATTQSGVELLDAFASLAQREAIKRCVEKKSSEVRSPRDLPASSSRAPRSSSPIELPDRAPLSSLEHM